jgi:hypothetical protein
MMLLLTLLITSLAGIPSTLGKTIFQIHISDLKNGDSKLLEDALKNDGALGICNLLV